MDNNTSFTPDQLCPLTGLYVSRMENMDGQPVTTFDIRMTRPNVEPALDTVAIHAIEHMGNAFLRDDPDWKDRAMAFEPRSCRTGFNLLLTGRHEPEEILDLIARMFEFILHFEGDIPVAWDRGSCLDINMAKYHARKYIAEVIDHPDPNRFHYPA